MKRIIAPLVSATLVCSFLAVSWKIFIPLHQRGIAQPVLWPLNVLAHLLAMPGSAAAIAFGADVSVHGAPVGVRWLTVDFAFYAMATAVIGLAWRRYRTFEKGSVPGLRRLMRFVAYTGVCLLAVLSIYALYIEPHWVVVRRMDFKVQGLPPQLAGLRIIQLSDVHMGPWNSTSGLRNLVDRVNDANPDVVLLTGDYVHKSSAYIEPAAAELGRLRPRVATLAVLGNHDWWEGPVEMKRALQKFGIHVIDNSRVFLMPDRQLSTTASQGLCISGIGDYWEDEPNWRKALGGVPSGMPRILLTHNPDALEDPGLLAFGPQIDLALAGHTHGGQVWLPLLGTPIVPSQYGQKYARGMKTSPLCPVYISTGIGTAVLPVRFGVRPELAVFTLR